MLPVAALLLAGCVTARMYPEEQLSELTRRCGLALGEIFQDAEEPRILFLLAPDISTGQLACVRRWARKRHLHLAYGEAVIGEGI